MTPTTADLARAQGHCSSCSAPILWAETARGKRMPIDPRPSDVGNVLLIVGRDAEGKPRLVAEVLSLGRRQGARRAGKTLRLPHWKSCPDADRHRRTRR